MTHSPSLWSFIANADFIVKLVLLILTAASVISWTFIIAKQKQLKETKQQILNFKKHFANASSLADCFQGFGRPPTEGTARLFYHAYESFQELCGIQHLDRQTAQDILNSRMSTENTTLIEELETNTNWLATIGSVAPYVGLFGTVWGIMSAFRSLGAVQSASISMVAPGIAEALIATAVGLFAAIPAVIAYNRFSHTIDSISQSLDAFQAGLTPRLLERWLAKTHTNAGEFDAQTPTSNC